MGQIHSRKFSLKSSKGFFSSFRGGRLLEPKNTMSVDVNALYFTHTSQSQYMIKKKQGPIIGHRAAQSAEYKILLIYVLGDNIDYRGRPAYAGRPKNKGAHLLRIYSFFL